MTRWQLLCQFHKLARLLFLDDSKDTLELLNDIRRLVLNVLMEIDEEEKDSLWRGEKLKRRDAEDEEDKPEEE